MCLTMLASFQQLYAVQAYTHPVEERFCCAQEGNVTLPKNSSNLSDATQFELGLLGDDDGATAGGKYCSCLTKAAFVAEVFLKKVGG